MPSARSRRPLIGITCYVEPARWGVWDAPAALLPYRYVERVQATGARTVILPPDPEAADDLVELLDGIVFAGGADLDPATYGEQPHPQTTGVRADRDAGEAPLLRAALERDLPVLGICRGMQLMAVGAGGTLVQHLPDVVGHEQHRPAPGIYGLHEVRLAVGSLARRILGATVSVPSYHHQGLAAAGSLTVSGWAHDDTAEVVEDPGQRFALGVLWHPEAGEDPRLFDAFVDAARA